MGKVLLAIFLTIVFTVPMSLLCSRVFEMPTSTILSMLWGNGCGVVIANILYRR